MASAFSSARRRNLAPSLATPPSSRTLMNRLRSLAATASPLERCTMAASSTGTVQSVLRIPSIRRRLRSVTSACSTRAGSGMRIRWVADSTTVAGSVAWSATTDRAMATGSSSTRALGARRCRCAMRARRSATVIERTSPTSARPSWRWCPCRATVQARHTERVPEGDTLFKVAERLRPALQGHRLTRFDAPRLVGDAPKLGEVVERVEARGKHLLIHFEAGLVLRTHLRMTGSWHVYRERERWQKPAHLARAVVGTDS